MTELFISEITNGISATGIKPGIIKVGTGTGAITDHEAHVLAAAAAASLATGVPITTHTDQGSLGDIQQKVLTDAGVSAQRMVIGHSCGTTDGDRVVVSHDSVWCWKGNPWPVGVSDSDIDRLTYANPRAFFEGMPLTDLA